VSEVDLRERILDLLDEAASLDKETGAGIPLLEEAVRLADAHGELELAFDARTELVDQACWSGHPDKMLVAFAWCLAQIDRHPDKLETYTTYWAYKWVLLSTPGFPEITRAQIAEMTDDIERRYRAIGASLRPVHYLRSSIAEDLGDDDEAARQMEAFEKLPRDNYSDCAACEADHRVSHWAGRGQDEKALALAAPILSGRVHCAEVPHRTYARLLPSLLRLGRVEEAADFHRRGYRLLAPTKKLLRRVGDHIAFLALTGNFPQGIRAVERHLPFALTSADRLERLFFLLDTKLLIERVMTLGAAHVRVKLPQDVPIRREDARYATADLIAWLDREIGALVLAFDRRNGNRRASEWVREASARHALARDYPI